MSSAARSAGTAARTPRRAARSWGHPAAALAWLANTLTAQGEHLDAGTILLSGALTASVHRKPTASRQQSSTGWAQWGSGASEPDRIRAPERGPGCRDHHPPRLRTGGRAAEETLLAALNRAGLGYRIGCRRGVCGVCKLHLLPGEVRYERTVADSVLTDEERIEGICLSCRAVPITNVVIELQKGDKLRRVLPLGFASGFVVKPQART